MTERRRLLCLSTYFPWPADSGGNIRVDGLLRALAAVYDVRALVPRIPDATTMASILAEVQRDLGITVETFVERIPRRSRPAAAAVWVRGAVARMPPWVYGHVDWGLVDRFPSLAQQVDGIVLLEDLVGVYPLLARLDGRTPVVADKHVVMARPRSKDDVGGGAPVSLKARYLRLLTSSFEKRYLALADHIVVTTPEDGDWLKKLYGRNPSAVIPTGVELLPAQPVRQGRRTRVGWLSALDVVDNVAGLKEFVRHGWPPLAELGYELSIAGRNPGPRVDDLVGQKGVRILGQVDSAREFTANTDVAVIPLWSGRGIKVKTLTWMAAGIPVAATPMALEGMNVEHGRECLIGETPEELSGHVRALLEDRELAESVGAAGRALVASTYTWDAVSPRFLSVVRRALEGSPSARRMHGSDA